MRDKDRLQYLNLSLWLRLAKNRQSQFSYNYTVLSWLIIHDDKTVMPRHQTFKFSYVFRIHLSGIPSFGSILCPTKH